MVGGAWRVVLGNADRKGGHDAEKRRQVQLVRGRLRGDRGQEALVERAIEDLRRRGVSVTLLPRIAARFRDAYDSGYDDKVKVN